MTPLDLQDDLVAELTEMFKDTLFKAPDGSQVPLHVYSQNIPLVNDDEDETALFPYLIVQLNNGDDEGAWDSTNAVRLVIIVGVYDHDTDRQGYRDAMNVYQRIYHRFQSKPNLNGAAVFNGEFHWANQQDDYYPYFFGACTMTFNIPAVRREDELT